MNEIPIHVVNPSPYVRLKEPITIGVPFARGTLASLGAGQSLHSAQGQPLPLQTRALSFWPDKSIKWLLCDFQADLAADGESLFYLSPTAALKSLETPPLTILKAPEKWVIDTGTAQFHIAPDQFRPFSNVILRNNPILPGPSRIDLADAEGNRWTPWNDRSAVELEGPVRAVLFFSGSFKRKKKALLNYEARLHLYAGSARVMLEMRLDNPRAALHPGNLWDLGDPASVLLQEWSMYLPIPSAGQTPACMKTDGRDEWHDIPIHQGGRLYQESSGGEHWDSPVHRNRNGRVPMTINGWRLTSENKVLLTGPRAQPLLWARAENNSITASIDHFWQRFPKAIALKTEELSLCMLPGEFPQGHELQGGEQITETVRFDFDAGVNPQPWGYPAVYARCAADVYRSAGILKGELWEPKDLEYTALVQTALDQKTGFAAKREQIDEYGWRNFGEAYADHESAFHSGAGPFISHYNNQYDLLKSFYKQYFISGDRQWEALARDLAKHVADIDINHTDEDREEYCRGLFWHTDHYLDAGLSTHRMASREHLSQKKNPAFCGGGPAAEHCYAGGMALHYYHSGDPRFQQLAISLANWCWKSLHGPQTVGAAMLSAAKSLSRWWRVKTSAPLWPRYPFTRGTANCLNAQLDALELTGSQDFLQRATKLVRGTLHFQDRPEERNLLNAELCWSYLVFLTALGRFLQVKRGRQELDGDYHYALKCLLLYARWMAVNEYPYLDKPELLEYPNETWSGQDLRKGVVLLHAARHAHGPEKQEFIRVGRYFLAEGVKRLLNSKTYSYTRPLALLLQNGWALEALSAPIPEYPESADLDNVTGRPTPRLTLVELLKRCAADLYTALSQTSIKREYRWVKFRLRPGNGGAS